MGFDNSVGAPISVRFDTIEARNTRQGGAVGIENDQLSNGFVLEYPRLGGVGEFQETEVVLDNQNTNINELTSLLPDLFLYSWNVVIGGDQNPDDYFILDTSKVYISAGIEVPFYLRAKSLAYFDTIPLGPDFRWPLANSESSLQEAEIKILLENGMPLALLGQIYVLDENGILLDSLLTLGDAVLAPAPIDGDGNVIGTSVQEVLVPLSAERYRLIQQGTQLRYQLRIETSEQGNELVRLTDQASLDIKMGVRATLSGELLTD